MVCTCVCCERGFKKNHHRAVVFPLPFHTFPTYFAWYKVVNSMVEVERGHPWLGVDTTQRGWFFSRITFTTYTRSPVALTGLLVPQPFSQGF